MADVHRQVTEFGFEFGAAKVERFASFDSGAVTIGISSPKGSLQVYVTKTGKIRVFKSGQGEMFVKPKEAPDGPAA